jgi:hypothetical protein
LGKIVILITISTYSSLKSNFTKLQTLSSFENLLDSLVIHAEVSCVSPQRCSWIPHDV